MAGTKKMKRASHSLDAVLDAAVVLLDESGESGLTFRALAAELGGGVASIYWYVASRDELLERASDHVLADVLSSDSSMESDPIDNVRTIAITLFDTIAKRPWLGAYFMRNTNVQPNALAVFEMIGQNTLELDLTAHERFNATSAVIGFVVGAAADLGQQPPSEVSDGKITRDEYINKWADRWRALDATDFPFITHIADEFGTHDDTEQFRAGLDLLLAGLRIQAAE